jgi:hypothetical protein
MARALPGVRFSIPYVADLDMDELARDALRLYLQKQLERIDARIERLAQAQMEEHWAALERAAWTEPMAAEIIWDGMLEMEYLHAMREAVIEALATL